MTETATTPAETKAAPKAKAAHPCTCSKYVNTATGARLGCNKTTGRAFAPGHDARLKSWLIKAGAAGQAVALVDAPDEPMDAAKAASPFGFAHQVASGIERAARLAEAKAAKAAEKAERAAARAAAKQEQATADTDTVKAKVGRGTFEGRVVDGAFIYTVGGRERSTRKHQLV